MTLYSWLTVFTVEFIRAVGAVSHAIALPASMDTAAVITLELVRSAGASSWRGNGKNKDLRMTLQAKHTVGANLTVGDTNLSPQQATIKPLPNGRANL